MYDVAIIGAGVIGAMTARALSKYDLKICVLEKEHDVAMGTTKANSAIVHAGFDAKENSLKARLNVSGSRMMASLCRDLGVKYKNNGALVIGTCSEDRNVLEELHSRGIQNGVRGLRILEEKELREIEPNLSSQAHFALYAPTSAIVCPYELTVAAMGNAMDNGVHLKCDFSVERIEKEKEGYQIFSKEELVSARFVVNCAGLFADRIASLVGDLSFRIHPRKGEYVLLDRECDGLISHTVFRTPTKMGKGILVTPTVDGNVLLGPTSYDMEEKGNTQTTAEGLSEVLEKASESVKGIPSGKVITSFCGLRAVGDTGDFIITSPEKGFWNVAGIESPGLSASPAIAEEMVLHLKEQGLELTEKGDFCPVRKPMHAFRDATLEEKNRLIRENPAYGKIICRCENVTEGEILDAIRQHPKARDLDGVKRRTRAQMGRCQGGFCSPHIIGLLAKEMGIPYESVTKFGKGSYLNIKKTK